jgi:prevent-host-death family protein
VDTFSTIGVRELRADLARALNRAAAGESTVITRDGRPVAQIGPLAAGDSPLDVLIAAGAVIPPRRAGTWRALSPVPVWAGVRIDQALRELRG